MKQVMVVEVNCLQVTVKTIIRDGMLVPAEISGYSSYLEAVKTHCILKYTNQTTQSKIYIYHKKLVLGEISIWLN